VFFHCTIRRLANARDTDGAEENRDDSTNECRDSVPPESPNPSKRVSPPRRVSPSRSRGETARRSRWDVAPQPRSHFVSPQSHSSPHRRRPFVSPSRGRYPRNRQSNFDDRYDSNLNRWQPRRSPSQYSNYDRTGYSRPRDRNAAPYPRSADHQSRGHYNRRHNNHGTTYNDRHHHSQSYPSNNGPSAEMYANVVYVSYDKILCYSFWTWFLGLRH